MGQNVHMWKTINKFFKWTLKDLKLHFRTWWRLKLIHQTINAMTLELPITHCWFGLCITPHRLILELFYEPILVYQLNMCHLFALFPCFPFLNPFHHVELVNSCCDFVEWSSRNYTHVVIKANSSIGYEQLFSCPLSLKLGWGSG